MFAEEVSSRLHLNAAGQMVEAVWRGLPDRFPVISLDLFVVMPNHFHGLVIIRGDVQMEAIGRGRAPTRDAPTRQEVGQLAGRPISLGDIIGAFKSITTISYVQGVHDLGWPPFQGRLWQRNYWEHIVRDSAELGRLRAYIASNPIRWAEDQFYQPPPRPSNL
jgi:REP element-mobilizing transposase RayT